MRIAVLVPDPDYPEPWRWAFDVEADVLKAAGCRVDAVAWTEVGDVGGYDLVMPLVAWGYHLDYPNWLGLLDRAEAEHWPMINPPALLRWNSDKAYLAELADRGVSTVPTLAVEACCDADLEEARRRFGSEWLVIKPPVSASASGTHRLGPNDDLPGDSARQPMIVQPLIEEISRTGEFSLMLFDGEFSHAVVKRPKSGDFRVQPHLGGITLPSKAPPGAERLAKQARRRPRQGDLRSRRYRPRRRGHAPDHGAGADRAGPVPRPRAGCRRRFHSLGPEPRSNSHCLIAEVRFGG